MITNPKLGDMEIRTGAARDGDGWWDGFAVWAYERFQEFWWTTTPSGSLPIPNFGEWKDGWRQKGIYRTLQDAQDAKVLFEAESRAKAHQSAEV